MSAIPTPELDATVTDSGDVVVPAEAVAKFVTVQPGDHVRVRILPLQEPRKNMYGMFADRPIGLDEAVLAETRKRMWSEFGTGHGA